MTSAHSHIKRPTRAEPGWDGPVQYRAGQGRVAPLCWGVGESRLWFCCFVSAGATGAALMSCEVISQCVRVFGTCPAPSQAAVPFLVPVTACL